MTFRKLTLVILMLSVILMSEREIEGSVIVFITAFIRMKFGILLPSVILMSGVLVIVTIMAFSEMTLDILMQNVILIGGESPRA
jgi:hypothetical protein